MADDFLSKLDALAKQSKETLQGNTLTWFLNQIKQLVMNKQKDIKGILSGSVSPTPASAQASSTSPAGSSVSPTSSGTTGIPDSPGSSQGPSTSPDLLDSSKSKDSGTRSKIDPINRDSQKMIQPHVLSQTSTPNQLMIGQMILYVYDPKHKLTLPYYDTFPLVFPLSFEKGSFLGLNMHYLPPSERAVLMNALYSLINNPTISEKTRLNISYDILKGASQFRGFRPCIKRYLLSHVRSGVSRINPLEWGNVLMLPIAKFEKATTLKIWNDSVEMMRKHK